MDAALPIPPHGALAVVKAAGDPNAQMARVAQVVSAEPTLTAALLRLVNSAAYGVGRPIGTVQQASMYLGTRAIRNIAVHHVVRSALAKVDVGAFDTRRFWEDSLRRAVVAQILARRAGFSDPGEAFTVGLLQDLGTLVLAVRFPAAASALQEAQSKPGAVRLAVEARLCGETHPTAFSVVGRAWGLPHDLLDIVLAHHDPDVVPADRERARLLEICRVADLVADVVQVDGNEGTLCRANDALAGLPSREPITLDGLLDEVVGHMAKVAADLDVQIGAQPSWDALILRASRAMMQMNENYESLTRRLEVTLSERNRAMSELQRANEALYDLAHTDALTRVLNRRAFRTAVETQHAEGPWPAALLMIDIDHFKSVNDRFGHACGDDVIAEVARRCKCAVRPQDPVGRLGGEEFAVMLPSCVASEATSVADRLCSAVRAEPVHCRDGTEVPVTVSVGGSAMHACTGHVDDWLRQADRALYESKGSGRDRVSWVS